MGDNEANSEEENSEGAGSNRVRDALFAEILERCRKAEIEVEDERVEGLEGDYRALRMRFPAGRGRRTVVISTAARASAFLALDIEDLRFVNGFDAIIRPSQSTIECGVRPFRPNSLRRIRPDFSPGSELTEPLFEVAGTGPFANATMAIVQPSAELEFFVRPMPVRYALVLSGVPTARHDDARDALFAASDGLFFDLDVKFDVVLSLQRQRLIRATRSGSRPERAAVTFPRSTYDREPMTLYWYGRGAAGMPLLQFLAYYQAIEFYFPFFAELEARRQVGNVLKDPAFNAYSDRHIGRVLSAVAARGRAGWGDERSQLRATLRGCVDLQDLHDFIAADNRVKPLGDKIKGLTDVPLRLTMPADDLIERVADRIYQIRCKIVHTKDTPTGEEVGLLLPFSKEADQLAPDIELVHFVAQRALVARSRDFSFARQ